MVLQPPPQVYIPAPPPPSAPPPTPAIQSRGIGEEEEVEENTTLRRISVPTTPSAGPSEPRRSGRTLRITGFYGSWPAYMSTTLST
jgi:hypothetical protein